MKQFDFTITDKEGIHATPAGILVAEAKKFVSQITIKKEDKQADAKRIFAIMSLIAKQGDTVTVICEGEDEDAAELKLKEVLKQNL